MKIVSACLCGINCKYNGGNNLHPYFRRLVDRKEAVPVCPEQRGGLPTPRSPSEIYDGTGEEVLKGHKRVIDKEGLDVTEFFLRGAYKTLDIARKTGAEYAILKSRSPSCGVGQVYDGSFTSILKSGDGVTAALMKRHGIEVISDEEFLRMKNF